MFPKPRGGAFVAVRSAEDVLVVRQSYRPGLDFPGGGLKVGERPEAAAARELAEEVGVTIVPADLCYLGTVRRGFRRGQSRDRLFELRLAELPDTVVDRREIIWAGSLSSVRASWRELQMPVRWYLRRFGPAPTAARFTRGLNRPRPTASRR